MTAFTAAAAEDYDDRIRRMAPGYDLALDLIVALARQCFPAEARVLLAGCGTGSELLRLAAAGPGWRFTAVEPSAAMLEGARAKVAAAGLGPRVDFVEALLADAPPAAHDAAVSALVLHFLPDDGAKAGFVADLGRRMRPGAPLLLTDYAEAGLPAGSYDRWLLDRGVAAEVVERAADWRRRVWQPVTPARVSALLAAAGFAEARPFFQALGFQGWLASAGASPSP
ncbi:class I SAM-dependent methyltransferase [Zavarzinia compransoris]|uniref:Class I SAM-dependent methyltransferase n=1 Tax=Zavarzinia compransoris TaxID=1264899 RepID=A0A317DX69_9PROT|nr:class I SAM-dependent methyltransferase [Zavarzinia compransoris]PWR19111.1 class I SAM-dependent methyltransferase [Zavarzinia compransoris]TDP49121.1 tRNA (cmo5U34)-methyltransferase [Zavarzinia compransoris]